MMRNVLFLWSCLGSLDVIMFSESICLRTGQNRRGKEGFVCFCYFCNAKVEHSWKAA